MSAEAIQAPEPLDTAHDVRSFACGVPSLDSYLLTRAMGDQRAEKSRTYVATVSERVVGYYTLAAGSVDPGEAPQRLARGQGRQPIPIVLLGRLAVDKDYQGRGLGEALLVEALGRSAAAADAIGARAVLVHAVDSHARAFYLKYGFEPSPTDPLHLMMLMKDIRRTLGGRE